jgi:hypothetical protein
MSLFLHVGKVALLRMSERGAARQDCKAVLIDILQMQ